MWANKIINKSHILLIGSLILAMGLRYWLVIGEFIQFNSDEAVVALMARHILQGKIPVFFYGQAYMGSLDAILVAFGFYFLGEHVWVIRLVQSILYLGVMVTTYYLGKAVFGSQKIGRLAVGLLALPTVNVVLYTTASLGGYGEALLIGNLTLLVSLRIAVNLNTKNRNLAIPEWAGLGFLIGLGIWAFGLTLVYSIPAGGFIAYTVLMNRHQSRRTSGIDPEQRGRGFERKYKPWIFRMISVFSGLMLGGLAWWGYALENGISKLITELRGEAILGVEGLPWLMQTLQHLLSLGIFGSTVIFGLRPPWDMVWLGLPLIPFVLVFWCAVILHISKSLRVKNEYRTPKGMLTGVILAVILGFIFSPFGADPSGRYFLPLTVPLALFASEFILKLKKKFGVLVYGMVSLIMIYNLWGIIQSAFRFPPGITTQFYPPARIDHRFDQELIAFLIDHGEKHGFTNYWVSYPLAFLSNEQLLFIPRLPYHADFRFTLRDDRYPPYREEVDRAQKIAYITTHHEELDRLLRTEFSRMKVSWKETQIGDYQVFYSLSKIVWPDELELRSGSP